jgi:hypothetical protein
VPYHYGRWAYDPVAGWIWFPGYTYAPAWVYWAYGPSYIGWAPSGWYDCYRPYYRWAYDPYRRAGDYGFGFYGRVRMNEIDLRPWTFVNPDGLRSNRVDQAALTTDVIRGRLTRGGANDALATVTGTPARFTRNELRDPAGAVSNIVRRGVGTGRDAAGSDMTSYFRRDDNLSPVVRERIVRSRPDVGGSIGAPSGVPTPGTAGTLEGRVGDRDGTTARGSDRFGPERTGTPGTDRSRIWRDTYSRDENAAAGSAGTVERGSSSRNWRDRIDRSTPETTTPSGGSTPSTSERTPQENWRGRTVQRGGETPSVPAEERSGTSRGSDVPRRIIDRIGGARVSPSEPSAPSESPRTYVPRESAPRRESSGSQPRASEPRESSRPRETPRAEPRSSPPPQRDSSSSAPKSSGDGGGGKIKRN